MHFFATDYRIRGVNNKGGINNKDVFQIPGWKE